MEEIYEAIEEKLKAAGYPGEVNGYEIYNDICDQIEDKENGEYLLMSKKSEDLWYEYRIQIMEEEFNLSSMVIHTPSKEYTVDFDS